MSILDHETREVSIIPNVSYDHSAELLEHQAPAFWLGLEDWKRDIVEAADQWESYRYLVIHKGGPTYILTTDSITGDVLDVETLTEFITNTELYIRDQIDLEDSFNKECYVV